jgi:hypothetical protein
VPNEYLACEDRRSHDLPSPTTHVSSAQCVTSDGPVGCVASNRHVGRSRVQISVQRPAILSVSVRGFPQSFQINFGIVLQIRPRQFHRCS